MPAYDFDGTYAIDPWDSIDQDERPWYDGTLREVYARNAVYSPHVTMQVDINAHRSRTVTFNDLIPPRPNISPIGNREMNASRLFMDSFQRSLTVERYGNGMSLHKESNMFNYWQKNGDYGLIPILESALGQAITDHFDMLARNQYFRNPFALYGTGDGSGFSAITTSHTITTGILDQIWLGMEDRKVPWMAYNQGHDADGDILCITSPGVIYDLKKEGGGSSDPRLTYVGSKFYTDGLTEKWNKEDGMYRGVRFIKNQLATLWNCGEVIAQTTIVAPLKPGAGAPDPSTTKVDGVFAIGQRGATHYVEVDDASGFSANQRITIHRHRHGTPWTDAAGVVHGAADSPLGVPGGVAYDDPMIQDVEIYAVDTVSVPNRIILKDPYMMVDLEGSDERTLGLETEVDTGVYGYITLGRNIHTALFLHSAYTDGVVAGVTKPIELYFPPAFDDYMSMTRIVYDFWAKYQLWNPQVFEVAFLAGSNRDTRGPAYIR